MSCHQHCPSETAYELSPTLSLGNRRQEYICLRSCSRSWLFFLPWLEGFFVLSQPSLALGLFPSCCCCLGRQGAGKQLVLLLLQAEKQAGKHASKQSRFLVILHGPTQGEEAEAEAEAERQTQPPCTGSQIASPHACSVSLYCLRVSTMEQKQKQKHQQKQRSREEQKQKQTRSKRRRARRRSRRSRSSLGAPAWARSVGKRHQAAATGASGARRTHRHGSRNRQQVLLL